MDQLQRASRKGKEIARLQAADELFFHRAERRAPCKLDDHLGVAGDGADGHAVTARDLRICDAHEPVIRRHHATKLRIALQGRAAAGDEIQHPAPFLIAHLCECARASHFFEQPRWLETGPAASVTMC